MKNNIPPDKIFRVNNLLLRKILNSYSTLETKNNLYNNYINLLFIISFYKSH